MNIATYVKNLMGKPMAPNATVNSEEFTEMKRANQMVINGARTITREILKLERALPKRVR